MSKVAEYLNEHLQGEVTTNSHVRRKFSTDGSVITLTPDMVVYPRTTSDIRKVARFCWQLAEKGHPLAITARGGGSDVTGGAIGNGVIVNTMSHMNDIFELDPKQKLVRVQPGVTFKALNDALKLHGLFIPCFPDSASYSTIGGAIANNASGVLSGKYGATGTWVYQLEVVLANGEVLQTGRLSKRDVGKKMGLQTFEGEIYRGIDKLFADNKEAIENLVASGRDNSGYNIADVKNKDGSVDLTPLIVGSQGTLGVISEIIMKVEPVSKTPMIGAFAFADRDSARDSLDVLRGLDPSVLELIDGRMFERAATRGKRYQYYHQALDQVEVAAVVIVEFDNASDHAKKKAAKKIAKYLKDKQVYSVFEHEPVKVAELEQLRTVTLLPLLPYQEGVCSPSILEGAWIPPERLESFSQALNTLESKVHVELPLCGHAGDNVYYVRPELNLEKVVDRQKIFKLLAEWATIVDAHNGALIGESCEGRVKASFAYQSLDNQTMELFATIKTIFDPLNIMNPGVKAAVQVKKLVEILRPNYDGVDYAEYGIF